MAATKPSHLHHYRLIERIGEGGMGVVWRAEDSKLEREVAIKLLPDALVADPESLRRFEREAKALAALDHPGIVRIYAVEDDGDTPYMVMELVRGRVLAELIPAGGFQLHELFEYGIAIVDALTAAHARDVTHRDLKPHNIMVTSDGRIKVLDFGLATRAPASNATPEDAETALTGAGTIIGTPKYMSPEQLRGERAGPASDLFSLGTVLYQMAVGAHPFRGETIADWAASILRDDPAPPSSHRPDLSAGIDEAILRCLSRDPLQRPRAHELSDRLKSLRRDMERVALEALVGPDASTTTRAIDRRDEAATALPDSILVVPFMDLSPQRDQGYFCIGVAEDIATALSGVEQLKVSTASRMDRDRDDPVELGRVLGAAAVLDGSVRRAADQLRVTVRLSSVADGSQLWSARFDRPIADLFAVQDEIADAVAATYQTRVARGPRPDRGVGPEAYAAYLRGRYFWGRRYEGGLTRALECFAEALSLEPDMALAHAGRADCFVILGHYGFMPPRDAYAQAREAVQHALRLAPDLAEAHTTMGWIHAFHDRDRDEGGRLFDRALALDPGYATGWEWKGIYLLGAGRFDDALESMSRAQQLDPLSLMISTMLGFGYYAARRFEKAERVLQRVLEMDARFVFAYNIFSITMMAQDRFDEAVAASERAAALSNREGLSTSILGHAYARAGRTGEAETVLRELEALGAKRYVSPLQRALVLLGLGRIGETLDDLERNAEASDSFFPTMYFAPVLDGLRHEPRFGDILRRMKLGSG